MKKKSNNDKQFYSNSTIYNTYYTKNETDDIINSLLTGSSNYDDLEDLSKYATSTAAKVSCVSDISDLKELKTGEIAYDVSTGNAYIGDSNNSITSIGSVNSYDANKSNTYTVSSSGGISWTASPYITTTTTPYTWTTSGSISIDPEYTTEFKMINAIIEYLREEELTEMLDSLNERGAEKELVESIVKKIVNSRHLSEEFIMHFIDFVDIEIIKIKYKSEIRSQAYPRLALLTAVE